MIYVTTPRILVLLLMVRAKLCHFRATVVQCVMVGLTAV